MENLVLTFIRDFLLATFQGIPLIIVVWALTFGAKLLFPRLEGNMTRVVSLLTGVVVSVLAKVAEAGSLDGGLTQILTIVFSGVTFGALASLAYDQLVRIVDRAIEIIAGELMETANDIISAQAEYDPQNGGATLGVDLVKEWADEGDGEVNPCP